MDDSILDKIDPVVLGQRLKLARESANIDTRTADRHISLIFSSITMIEAGKIRIEAHDLFKLAQLYKTQVSLLLNGPLPYRSDEEAIQACIAGEIGEGALATFLGVDRLETRRRVQEYEARNV